MAKKTTKKTPVKKKAAPKKSKPTAAKKKTVNKKKTVKKVPTKKKAAPKKSKKAAAQKKTVSKKKTVKKAPAKKKTPTPKRTTSKTRPTVAQPTGMYNGIKVCERPRPFPNKSPYTKKELNGLREALQAERKNLIEELASMYGVSQESMGGGEDHPGYSLHMADHATDLQTAEASMGVRSIEEERLELVDNALQRIQEAQSHYGLCLACGARIGIRRLVARPHAHLCMKCQERYEQARVRRGW